MFRFTRLTETDLPMILAWRLKRRVTRYMKSDISNDLVKQRQWFRELSDPYWVVSLEGRPIGLLNCQDDNSFGFYIGEDDAVPLGGLVLPFFYNHYFEKNDLLRAEVMAGNDGIMEIHRFHGYRELDVRPKAVLKYGRPHDIHVFELTKAAWVLQARRYAHLKADFE